MKTFGKCAPTRRAWVRGLRGRRGNSLAEVAVFGTIALSAVGVLVSYGDWFAKVQAWRMSAFRGALAQANSGQAVTANAQGGSRWFYTGK